MMIKNKLLASALLTLSLTGCGVMDWLVYKPDITQGNYIEDSQVEQLRIGMSKNQVEYILGRPVLRDSFASNTWYYIYNFKSGRDASVTRKDFILEFQDDKLITAKGDYDLSEDFYVPLEQLQLPRQ